MSFLWEGEKQISLISVLVLFIRRFMYIHPRVEVGRYIQILGMTWDGMGWDWIGLNWIVMGNKKKSTSIGTTRLEQGRKSRFCLDDYINAEAGFRSSCRGLNDLK